MAKKTKQTKKSKPVKKTAKPGFSPVIALTLLVAIGVVVGGGMYYVTTITGFEDSSNPGITVKASTDTNKGYNTFDVDQTEGWLTYVNDEVNYSVKYPSDWTYSDDSLGNPAMFADELAINQEIVTELLQGSKIEIVWEDSQGATLASAVESKGIGETILSETDATVDGLRAIRQTGYDAFGSFNNIVYFINDDKLFTFIQYIPVEDSIDEYSDIFDLMLDTFKFADITDQLVGNDADEHGCIGSAGYTWCEEKQKCLRTWEETCTTSDSTNASITDDWLTYTNDTYGFNFRYPIGWNINVDEGASTIGGDYYYIVLEDDSGINGTFIVSPISEYGIYQDGIWDDSQEQLEIDSQLADVTIYTPSSESNWVILPAKRSSIIFSTAPNGWQDEHSMNFIAGTADDFTVLESILSTFQFTN